MFLRLTVTALLLGTVAQLVSARPLTVEDLDRVRDVSDARIDPKGEWVAYAVREVDVRRDKRVTHLWMSSTDGRRTVQLTARDNESESNPRWSPDGNTLAFISSRGGDDDDSDDRLWLLDRAGGEARPGPALKGSVVDFTWSPDGKRMAVLLLDPDPDTDKKSADGKKQPQPIVIDRFQFKADIDGYLGARRQRLMLVDLSSGEARRLTTGEHDEFLPAFSPDGRRIAFVSNRDADPDRSYNSDLWTVAVDGSASEPRRLTSFAGADNDPDSDSALAWSPDGRSIAYLQGGPIELFAYGTTRLAVVPADGGAARIVTADLDRNVSDPSWSRDGKSLRFLVEDDGARWVGEAAATGGRVRRLTNGGQVIQGMDVSPNGRITVLASDPSHPAEVHALSASGTLTRLSRQNDAWLKDITLAPVEDTRLKSKDGTAISGFLLRPVTASAGPAPTILRIHGGPQSQYDRSFNLDWQLLAAQGYAVVAANPRGSTGRGQDFAKGIYAAWGSVDVPDVLAAVDDAVSRGIADPARLGVGGWSYGGMLTNYVIASDTRFKAAVSGASIANVAAGYGTDQYIRDYEAELGKPWEKPENWARVSYPFLHADRIKTPTLFIVGKDDFNVPALASEQMYQALRSQNVATRLILYPGQYHGLTRPSFLRDRARRTLDWYRERLAK